MRLSSYTRTISVATEAVTMLASRSRLFVVSVVTMAGVLLLVLRVYDDDKRILGLGTRWESQLAYGQSYRKDPVTKLRTAGIQEPVDIHNTVSLIIVIETPIWKTYNALRVYRRGVYIVMSQCDIMTSQCKSRFRAYDFLASV